jgi:hypothetical protein
MICQQLNTLLGFDCSPFSESGEVVLVSTPFKFDDGDSVPVFAEQIAGQIRFFDDGQTLMHFIGRGVRIENKKQASFLINTAAKNGAAFTDQGEIEVWAPLEQAQTAFAKYVSTLIALTVWEADQKGSNTDASLFVEEVAMALRAWKPKAVIELEQPFVGISGRTYKVDFVVDGAPIVVTGTHPNSVGSILHKLVDIRGLIENMDTQFTVVIDDRADPEGAKKESLIVQSLGTVFPFTALEALAPTSSAAH